MSTLKSSAENLTLNADGSGNDVIIQSDGSTLVTIDGSQSSVGIGTATPTGNAKVHIYNGASGQAAASNNTELTIENSSNTGIQFLTPNTSLSGIWFGDPENKEIGRMYYTHSENSLKFFTDASERLRIDSDGIKFNADTAAANALDDYEEGEYAPTVVGGSSGSFGLATGENSYAYVKIGKLVHIQGEIHITSDSSASGEVRVSLPFANADLTDSGYVAIGSVYTEGAGTTVAGKMVARISGEGGSYFRMYYVGDDGGSEGSLTHSEVDANFYITVGLTYFTDS